jgi:hypothetical protein
MVQYVFDLILLFSLDKLWHWLVFISNWRVKVCIKLGGSQQRHMEHQVDFPQRRKCQAIGAGDCCIVGNWSDNLKGAEAPKIQLFQWVLSFKVSGV